MFTGRIALMVPGKRGGGTGLEVQVQNNWLHSKKKKDSKEGNFDVILWVIQKCLIWPNLQ